MKIAFKTDTPRGLLGITLLAGLIILVSGMIFCPNVHAANHYIRQGAAGSNDGTDWTNAWTAQPATWVRGDTYYYADGEINEYIIMNVADQGTDRITLKKATAGDHGTETGWSAGYGDGQFHFTATTRIMLLWSSYVTIDGQTGGGPGSWTTGFGFKFSIPDSTNGDNFSLIDFGRAVPVTNIVLTHCEFKQAGMNNWEPVADGYNNHQKCLYFLRVETAELSYCYLHEANQTHLSMAGASDITIEYNYFENRSGAPHGESIACSGSGLASNNIFRYNIWKDCSGTGIIVMMTGYQGGMHIYGNVLYSTDRDTFYTTNGAITSIGAAWNNDMLVYHNDLINLGGGQTGISYRNDHPGNMIFNNLWYNCENANYGGADSLGYNVFSDCSYTWAFSLDATDIETTGDLFNDWENEDFNLKTNAPCGGAGINRGGDFTDDWNGDTHPEPPDIGALVYDAGAAVYSIWYADSEVGSSGDGTSMANAKKTLAELPPIMNAGDIAVIQNDFTGQQLIADADSQTAVGADGQITVIDGKKVMDAWVTPSGVTTTVNDVADDDCYRNSTYYEEYGTNTLLVAGDAFGDSSSFIIKVTIPADYSSGDSTTVRFPDAQRVGGATLPKLNFYIENKAATSITNAATYNFALGDSGSVHILVEYGLVNQTDTVFIDIQPLIDEAIADGIAAGEDVNICCKVIDIETNQYNQFDALEASDKPAYVKWDYNTAGGGAPADTTMAPDNDGYYRGIVPDWRNDAVNSIGHDAGGDNEDVLGFIFPVPQGATIDSMFLKVRFSGTQVDTDGFLTKMYAEKSNNPDNINSTGTWTEHVPDSLTTANVDWDFDMDAWVYVESPDLKEIAQEIVDMPGWVAYNKINLIWRDEGETVRGAYYSDTGTTPPALRVYWTPAGGGGDEVYVELADDGSREHTRLWIGTDLAVQSSTVDSVANNTGVFYKSAIGDTTIVNKADTTSIFIDGYAFAFSSGGYNNFSVERIVMKHFNGSAVALGNGHLGQVIHCVIDSSVNGVEGTKLFTAYDNVLQEIATKSFIAAHVDSITNDYNWVDSGASYTNASKGANSISTEPFLLSDYTFTVPYSPLRNGTDLLNYSTIGVHEGDFVLTIGAPVGEEIWDAGTLQDIIWERTGVTDVKIEYSNDNGLTWESPALEDSLDATLLTRSWDVPNDPTEFALVRVSDAHYPNLNSFGDVFTISSPVDIRFSGQGRFAGQDAFDGTCKFNGSSPF